MEHFASTGQLKIMSLAGMENTGTENDVTAWQGM